MTDTVVQDAADGRLIGTLQQPRHDGRGTHDMVDLPPPPRPLPPQSRAPSRAFARIIATRWGHVDAPCEGAQDPTRTAHARSAGRSSVSNSPPATRELLEGQVSEPLPARRQLVVQLGQAKERPTPERGEHHALDDRHGTFSLGAVARLAGPGRNDHGPIVRRHLGVRPVQLRLVATGPDHRRLRVVRDGDRRGTAEILKRADMPPDPAGQVLRESPLQVRHIAHPQRRNEDVNVVELPGLWLHDRERQPGPVDEQLLAGPVGLPEHHIEVPLPPAIPLTEAAVLIAVGIRVPVLLPEQAERHAFATKLAVDLLPHRLGPRTGPPGGGRIEPPFQCRIVQLLREGPRKPQRFGPMEHAHHGAVREPQAVGNLASRQMMGGVEPKNLANLAHRYPPACRRARTPVPRELCSPRLRTGVANPCTRRPPTLRVVGITRNRWTNYPGIGGRFAPESVDDLNWNAWSICVGIRNPKGERTFPPRPGTQSAEPKRGQESGRSIVVMTAWETRQERRGPAQLKRRW